MAPVGFFPNERISKNADPLLSSKFNSHPIFMGEGRHKLQGLRGQTRETKSLTPSWRSSRSSRNQSKFVSNQCISSIILLEEWYIRSNVSLNDHVNQFENFSRHIFILIFITLILLALYRKHFMRKLYHKKKHFFRYDLLLHSRSPSWIGKTFQPLYVKPDVYVSHVCFSRNHQRFGTAAILRNTY